MPQVKSYFGVHLPPFKEKKWGAGAASIRFVITGTIPSKKNNQQAVSVRRDAKNYLFEKQKSGQNVTFQDALAAVDMVYSKMRGNEAYQSFVKEQKPKIQKQMQFWSTNLFEKGLVFPLQRASMNLRLYFKDRYITDTVNKQQTIQDLLIECGVIANDDYKTLNPISSASACYYEELVHNIAFISLSFQLPKKTDST
jgi:hypothetical protein